MDMTLNNMELIAGLATIAVPALLPARYAMKINIVTRFFKATVNILEKLDNSKGGLTLKQDEIIGKQNVKL